MQAWENRNYLDSNTANKRCGGRQMHAMESVTEVANRIMNRSVTRKHHKTLRQE